MSQQGTPQGGIISRVLANLALDGLERELSVYVRTIDWTKVQLLHPTRNRYRERGRGLA
jgi:retron-type reverse transcriptase